MDSLMYRDIMRNVLEPCVNDNLFIQKLVCQRFYQMFIFSFSY